MNVGLELSTETKHGSEIEHRTIVASERILSMDVVSKISPQAQGGKRPGSHRHGSGRTDPVVRRSLAILRFGESVQGVK
jgi:hypothetical protein